MYDAIIIGSGIGGLTCGAFLAHAGMRVLVLEKHTKIGGYAHSFRRRRFIFESGVHSVPLAPDGYIRRFLRTLGVEHLIEPVELPEMYASAAPSVSFTMPARTEAIREALLAFSPGQRTNLQQLFSDARLFYKTVEEADFDFENTFVTRNREFVHRYHNRPFKDYIDSVISDDRLRQVFYAQWPYIGAAPGSSATVFHFMMFIVHFLEGSHFCKGGFSSLAEALARVIRDRGGEVRTGCAVTGIRAENRRAKSVVTADGGDHECRILVSNISPYIVHRELLGESDRSRRWIRRLENLQPSVSTVGVYLGLTPDFVRTIPSCLNFWSATDDYEAVYADILANRRRDIDHLIALRHPFEVSNPAMLLMHFIMNSFSGNWKEEKLRMADRMIDCAEKRYPGLRNAIQLMEVGSPATFERYTANTDGALYGFCNTCSLYGEARMPTKTHVNNLYQVGHWGRPGGGLWNVMVNAYAASKTMLRENG